MCGHSSGRGHCQRACGVCPGNPNWLSLHSLDVKLQGMRKDISDVFMDQCWFRLLHEQLMNGFGSDGWSATISTECLSLTCARISFKRIAVETIRFVSPGTGMHPWCISRDRVGHTPANQKIASAGGLVACVFACLRCFFWQ